MMETFLKAVLGETGTQALMRAAERTPSLRQVIVPRTLVAWLGLAVRDTYEGRIPGVPNSYVRLQKKEERFNGDVSIGDSVHAFDDATILHTAAALAVSMGVSTGATDIRGAELLRLGKSLDLLVKAKALSDCLGEDLVKIELPGQAAKPVEPEPPLGFTSPTPTQPKAQPKKAAKREMRLETSSFGVKCKECGARQFQQRRFVGCTCLKSLAKSMCVTTTAAGTFLEFASSMEADEVLTVITALR